MRKLVAYQLLSLDGVAESPDEFIVDWDDDMDANLGRVIGTQDAVLLGRSTYDDWAKFWPSSDIEPFASFINSVQKYVVTSTVPEESWFNTTSIRGDLADAVVELKQRSGADIGVHGSIALTQALIERNLVDELRLVIAPAIVGRGRKLFDGGSPRRLRLQHSSTSQSGSLLLDYELTGEAAREDVVS